MLNRHVMGLMGFVVACAVGSGSVLADRALFGSDSPDRSGRVAGGALVRREFRGPVSCCSGTCISIAGLSGDVVHAECLAFACTDGTHAYFARLRMRSAQAARSRFAALAVAGTDTTVAATPTLNGTWTPSGHLSLFLRHDAIAATSGATYPGESRHGEEWVDGDTICMLFGPSASHILELEQANPGGCW